ncbi:tyrosine-type recombinase/integrase [Ligilactobacillus saerimneri]|uniref:tyrosine-type recombinase/integrase n=1 Tax=Ligilactobacillus saerimneri TaxID=228229 RepID=UPI001C112084|nr:tyrosine-type recombinase/integrase [Ligilactobacillus saerimneri]MBU5308856.1 site-specific integrase [Ligilactobacillus saerimneri]
MSYVRKLKDGWRGYATYKDKDGKYRNKSAGKFKLKKDAIQKARELETELNTGNIELKEISFADYYLRWYETYKKDGLAPVTSNRYKIFCKVIRDHFGDTLLKDIRRSDYQQFINWYGKSHAMSSVSKLNGSIRTCVSYAMDDDIISKDFTSRVNLVANPDKEYQVEYLNHNELITLKKAVLDRLGGQSVSTYMILTAIYTGARKSEIQALTWKDIDFMHSTISITKSWDEKKKTFKPTKTQTSNRTVPVPKLLLDKLSDLKANRSTMVFKNILGTIPTSNALNKMLRSIMKDAGIGKSGFHFHSLRHVHVAYLISQGVDIYAISKRLGHAKVSITLDTYSYLIDEYRAKNDDLIVNKLRAL